MLHLAWSADSVVPTMAMPGDDAMIMENIPLKTQICILVGLGLPLEYAFF